ncbi:MAG TPA: TonB-dependent receptor [Hyphomicrobiales bacterium]|nr:TonB-dependent receptor [Hyphomicrobiales bacterium]
MAQSNASAVEELTVTGSRIRQSDGFTNPVPLTTMTNAELFDFAPGSSVAEQLDVLPQFFGNVSLESVPTGLTSSSGSTSLDLRNLEGKRTLVLFDGMRVVPSSKEGTVNVDFFPTALVRSVDVVTGGASAAYGADAVGGVTNFVIDRQFQGFKLNTSAGRNEFGDGDRWSLSMAGGRKFGERFNVIASFDARWIDGFSRSAEQVPEQQRIGLVTNPAWKASDPPGTNPIRLTLPHVATTANSPYGLILGTGTPLDWHRFTPDASNITPFVLGSPSSVSGANSTQSFAGGPDAEIYNRANGGIGGTQAESRSGFLGLQYELSDSFTVFGQAMIGNTRAADVLDRGGILLYGNWAPTVYADNAYLPDNVRQIMSDYDLASFKLQKNGSFLGVPELGIGTEDSKAFHTRSYSAGFDWDVPIKNWHLRGVAQKGVSRRFNSFGSRWRMDRAFLAMDAVRDPSTGAIVCRVQLYNPTEEQLANSPAVQGRISGLSTQGATKPGDPGAIPLRSPIGLDNTIRDCIPFNVMGSGNISQAALDYVNGPSPKIGTGEVKQDFAEILLDGELFEGWGYGAINYAFGLTWREQSFWDDAHPKEVLEFGPPLNDPNLGIQGIPVGYTSGSPNLHYIATLPILSGDMSVWEYFGELNIPVWEGTVLGQDQHFSVDLAYRESDYERSGPVESWKVGLDYQVLNSVRLRFTTSTDVREPTFSELYDAQGINGAFRDPRFGNVEVQTTMLNGGNPNLSPEEGDTVTAGIVWTPGGFLEGLQASVDWYDVTIEGAVGQLGAQRIVDECFINNVQSLCEQLDLDPATSQVTRVYNTFLNVAQATVEGTDLELAYRYEPNFFGDLSESFSFRGLAGYVRERTDTPLGGSATDRSGNNGSPDLTAVVTANYNVGPYSFQMQGRYTDSVTITGTWIEGIDVDKNKLPSITWWSARLGYTGETDSGSTWRVGLNVQNVFDKRPVAVPNVSTRFAIQGLAGDTYGRRYNLNFDYSF